ncbi:uncharacterized protein LOC118169159 [Oxyura jamaicensis]|uniref:uncharacterized protein LOC118169159 n=1 Tax=Oxyura jamaicensis TaxID=8884 RepID=UPI0015A6CB81|nr:uncharacterized protein LOC118169159 [Oxyura jamaicensis]
MGGCVSRRSPGAVRCDGQDANCSCKVLTQQLGCVRKNHVSCAQPAGGSYRESRAHQHMQAWECFQSSLGCWPEPAGGQRRCICRCGMIRIEVTQSPRLFPHRFCLLWPFWLCCAESRLFKFPANLLAFSSGSHPAVIASVLGASLENFRMKTETFQKDSTSPLVTALQKELTFS